ncbi:MAG: isoprenyl transferase [Bacteroidales bacterium]|nr:isoprenyl transferase [Bacteroidales bacterium]MBQ9312639.1 isoprenyl transferase [Bacteroidales bacterium]
MNTNFKEKINKENIPQHVAIIMDGNGRWAKKQGKERIFGHQHGVDSVRNVCEASAELGVKYLTLYTFSKENWNRPKEEVDALMKMLVYTIGQEEKTLMDNNIRLENIGDTSELGQEAKEALLAMIEKTKANSGMTLILALNYSARWEIIEMVKQISAEVKQGKIEEKSIDENTISSYLTTKQIPDVDLLIRTSGELRISNFLLWQIAYSELYFTEVLWPDFTKEEFYKAVCDYQNRERRFGKTSEQIVN